MGDTPNSPGRGGEAAQGYRSEGFVNPLQQKAPGTDCGPSTHQTLVPPRGPSFSPKQALCLRRPHPPKGLQSFPISNDLGRTQTQWLPCEGDFASPGWLTVVGGGKWDSGLIIAVIFPLQLKQNPNSLRLAGLVQSSSSLPPNSAGDSSPSLCFLPAVPTSGPLKVLCSLPLASLSMPALSSELFSQCTLVFKKCFY